MLLDRQSHLDFHSRALLQFCFSISSQLPESYKMELDAETFLRAFTLKGNDGQTLKASPWPLAPTGLVRKMEGQDSLREQARRSHYIDHYEHVAPGIPSAPLVHPIGACYHLKQVMSSPEYMFVGLAPIQTGSGSSKEVLKPLKPRRNKPNKGKSGF